MTPAQARALIAGPGRFVPVRLEPMLLLGSMPLKRVARVLQRSPDYCILRLQAVWSWASGAWSPTSTWGELVPVAVVDLIFGVEGAAAALVRCHLAFEVPVGGIAALRLEHVAGAPNLKSRHAYATAGRAGARVRWQRYRDAGGGRR